MRLGSEIFQRCCHILEEEGKSGPYTVYDPCCGGGYILASIAFLHGEKIAALYASDIDETAVQLAEKNFGLLSSTGLQTRIDMMQNLLSQYGKDSHKDALKSAQYMKSILEQREKVVPIHTYAWDITQEEKAASNPAKDINIV